MHHRQVMKKPSAEITQYIKAGFATFSLNNLKVDSIYLPDGTLNPDVKVPPDESIDYSYLVVLTNMVGNNRLDWAEINKVHSYYRQCYQAATRLAVAD